MHLGNYTQKVVFVPLPVQLLPSFFFMWEVFIWAGDDGDGQMLPDIAQTQLRNESWSTAQTVDLASKSPPILIQSEVSQRNSGTNRSSQPT